MTMLLPAIIDFTQQYISELDPAFITGGAATASADNTFEGSNNFSKAMNINVDPEIIKGISGSLIITQPEQGSAYKKVIIYCDDFTGDVYYKFPVAFTYMPLVSTFLDTALISAIAESVTVAVQNASGFIIIEGF